MKLDKVFINSIASTTVMTLFSHIIAEMEKENFSEPLLLSNLIHRAVPQGNSEIVRTAGWAGHYTVGFTFAAAYEYCLFALKKKPSFINSTVAGIIGGLAGIAWWKTVFKTHPSPPALNYRKFYTQLFFAHVIFSWVNAVTMFISEGENENVMTNRKDVMSLQVAC